MVVFLKSELEWEHPEYVLWNQSMEDYLSNSWQPGLSSGNVQWLEVTDSYFFMVWILWEGLEGITKALPLNIYAFFQVALCNENSF